MIENASGQQNPHHYLQSSELSCNCSALLDILQNTNDIAAHNPTHATPNPIVDHHILENGDECMKHIRRLLLEANREAWVEMRQQPDYLASADVYSVVILSLFASIIVVLMVRAIKPSETLDDQVTILLSSMRVRVEYEDNVRQKRKLQEAKLKAQRWLAEVKIRGVKKLSFRRSNSNTEFAPMEMAASGVSRSVSIRDIQRLSTDTINSSCYQQTVSIHSVPSASLSRSHSPSITGMHTPKADTQQPRLLTSNLVGGPVYINGSSPSSDTTPTPSTFGQAVLHSSGIRERCASSLSTSFRNFFHQTGSDQNSQQAKRPRYLNQRACSYQFLPEIVVTTTRQEDECPKEQKEEEYGDEDEEVESSSRSSRQYSRSASSSASIDFDGTSLQDSQYDIVFDV
ncbi:hypothetical protein Ddc_04552 [Ditylenchus destructor]|nr:hypothetical protein Ddc_04552 [Ditylenchus destructor]